MKKLFRLAVVAALVVVSAGCKVLPERGCSVRPSRGGAVIVECSR